MVQNPKNAIERARRKLPTDCGKNPAHASKHVMLAAFG